MPTMLKVDARSRAPPPWFTNGPQKSPNSETFPHFTVQTHPEPEGSSEWTEQIFVNSQRRVKCCTTKDKLRSASQ